MTGPPAHDSGDSLTMPAPPPGATGEAADVAGEAVARTSSPAVRTPRVSVALPVYNAGPWLRPAIDSLLAQTWSDFEVIAIDDGSTDGSGTVLDEVAARDPRFRVVHRANRGVIAALNDALDLARGDYVARMDADDLSEPERFRRQVEFLDANPDTVAVGCGYALIGEMSGDVRVPRTPQGCRDRLLVATSVPHAASMIRRSALHSGGVRYNPDFAHAEDFKLFSDLAAVGQLANLPDVLYRVRIHDARVSEQSEDAQHACHLRIVRENLLRHGFSPSQADRIQHRVATVMWAPPSARGRMATLRYLVTAMPATGYLLAKLRPWSVRGFILRTLAENLLLTLRGPVPSDG